MFILKKCLFNVDSVINYHFLDLVRPLPILIEHKVAKIAPGMPKKNKPNEPKIPEIPSLIFKIRVLN